MTHRVGGNLYLQHSAEYRACCLTIYKSAELRMRNLLDAARPRPAKPAVVLDLDETVLDNSAFQTFLYKAKMEYSDKLWAEYEEKYPQDVTLIPGARTFIHKAQAAEVAVVLSWLILLNGQHLAHASRQSRRCASVCRSRPSTSSAWT